MGHAESSLIGAMVLSNNREELDEEDSPLSIGLVIWVLHW